MCFGVGYGKKSFDDLNLKVSEYCIAPNFDVCEDSHEHCVGVNSGEFIYETKIKPASKGTEYIWCCKFFVLFVKASKGHQMCKLIFNANKKTKKFLISFEYFNSQELKRYSGLI